MGYTINLIGGNKYNWIHQHNINHHTYTNVHGADEDLEGGHLIRLSPHGDWKPMHRFQHIYSWFLYLLGTIGWVSVKDFIKFHRYYQQEKNPAPGLYWKELAILTFSKIIYFSYLVVIPWLVLDVALWQVIIGLFTIHFAAGFILTVVFQLAHVVETTDHDTIEGKDTLPNSWAIHQVKTTSNFARDNWLLNWYVGGLNFQVEHHLFPHICHVHYRKISDIVKQTVEEHGLTYHEFKTFRGAVKSHYRTLKQFGQPVKMPQAVGA